MWYEKSSRRILIDLHFPEWDKRILENFNAKQWIDNLIRANVDCGMFYAKDHYGNSYYPTKVGHQHKNLKGRDILGEVIKESKKKGLYTVVYLSLVWDKFVADNHPEWTMKDSKGNNIGQLFSIHICYNSGYKDYFIQQVKELLKRYKFNGFLFDMVNHAQDGCYCKTCKQLFKEKFGYAMPTEQTWDERWGGFLEFRYSSNQRFAEDVVAEIKKISPETSVFFNYHGHPPYSWDMGMRPFQHSRFNDYNCCETYPSEEGVIHPSRGARFLEGLGKTFGIFIGRFNRAWDYTTKPIPQLKWEVFTALANGANHVSLIDQPFHDGRLDEVVYNRLSPVYKEVKEKIALFRGMPIKHVALYYSVKTRDWYGREKSDRYLISFNGAFKSLLESHLPTDIIFDETISLEKLKEYPLLFLANVAILSEEEVEIFKDYVAQGGSLVATYETGLYDEYGRARKDFALAELFGANYAGKTEFEYNYIKMGQDILGKGIEEENYVLVIGPGCLVRNCAEAHGQLWVSFFNRTHEKFFSHNMHPPFKSVGPAIIVNQYGKGRVIYVPCRLAASYGSRYILPEHRKIMYNLVKYLVGEPPITVIAPINAEVSVREAPYGKGYIVHLIGFNAVKGLRGFPRTFEEYIAPMMEEFVPYWADIKIGINFSKVKMFRRNGEIHLNGNIARVYCQDVHEAVIIKKK